MTELQKKLDKAKVLRGELMEMDRSVKMKSGQLDDLMKSIMSDHLGFPKDIQELSFPDVIEKAYTAGANGK